ncbi:hypothetical protein C8A01DRAFT_19028, partial [Parachaetomium inaequale]
LDITVQSPSDARHHFPHIDVGCDSQATADAIDDLRHGWRKGMRVSWPPEGAFNRLFMDIALSPEFWRTLPQVTAVTGLCLRRQTTRRWNTGAVRELVKHLSGLQELHYEPWREWDIRRRTVTDTNTRALLESLRHTARELTRVVLFEDFSEAYTHSFVVFSPYGIPQSRSAEQVRTPSRDLTMELAMTGARLRRLEHLSAAFLVDAKDFFPVVQRAGTGSWNKLTSLTLTSLLLAPARHSGPTINNLLEQAALAAARLPALNSMEVWNGRKALACVFRYQAPPLLSLPTSSSVDQHLQAASARLTWRATWFLAIEPRVVEAWRTVACKRRPSCDLQVVHDILGAAIRVSITSHGDAIRHLDFSHDVLRPVSLSQIQRENLC